MRGTVADEHLRHLAEVRIDAWLWLVVREQGGNIPLERFGVENSRDYLSKFVDPLRFHELIEVVSRQRILPIDQLQWIANDERQINWLLTYVTRKFVVNFHPSPPNLTGKELLLAKIDFYDIDLYNKRIAVNQMRIDWNEYLKSDSIFKWFKGEEEIARCEFAWEWLIEYKKNETKGREAVTSHRKLLMFFDWIEVNDAQKKLDVASIKKRWSQQKYRKKLKGKKQYNFLLTDQAISDLDKMASQYEVSRPQVIEALIKMEVNLGNYLPQKFKKTSWN